MSDFNLGLFIKEHRRQAGLTQLELANLAGVGKTTVFDIEKNKETVSWNKLLAIASKKFCGHKLGRDIKLRQSIDKVWIVYEYCILCFRGR